MFNQPKFRIIYVLHEGDPCHWQLQKRHYIFFWKNACGNVSSATTAAHEMIKQMKC
ncbi:hypothetical protein [Vibrio anguillarum]|uniref:hypothetical protein n=1 Tax=Vibrio anguillarum TaxID=55601 RepID=UPI0018C27EAB|nr:hypothetical protein [Vibrio anguillarum]